MRALINGVATDQLSLSDRAIHYGDGLFETIAICNGRIEFWQRHMQRLARGCKRLGMTMPDSALLLSEARTLITNDDGVLKIIISRGQGGRGYRPLSMDESQPTRIIVGYPWPDYPAENSEQGIALRYCTTSASLNPALAGMKHLNRLEQVLARAEWSDPAIAEGLMFDMNGRLIEGTMSNLFFVRSGALHTPDLSNSGVAGIIRKVILELANSLNIPVHCQHYSRDDLECADEIFITNSIIGLWPVRQIQVQQIEQHSWGRGAVTQQLLDALNGKRQQKGEYEIV
jgi:4-amino-4-deoxychorismate lyase